MPGLDVLDMLLPCIPISALAALLDPGAAAVPMAGSACATPVEEPMLEEEPMPDEEPMLKEEPMPADEPLPEQRARPSAQHWPRDPHESPVVGSMTAPSCIRLM